MLARIPEVEADLRAHLRRVFPDVALDARLRLRTLTTRSSHECAVLEAVGQPRRRLFLKGPVKPGLSTWQDLATERALLRDVAPRICQANPATRCPRVVGEDLQRGVLILEMVEGPSLDALVFGLGRDCPRRGLPELLRLTGEWLARFHALTRTGEAGNPFAWLVDELTSEAAAAIVGRYGEEETYAEVCGLARRFRDRYASWRSPRCAVHHNFSLHHVLVQAGRIYVVDLASSRVAFPFLDLAAFNASYDVRLPWRRAWGARQVGLEAQMRCFLDGYASVAGPFSGPEEIAMRFARVQGIVKFCLTLYQKTWTSRLQARLARPWLRHRFRVVCREELAALKSLLPVLAAPAIPRELVGAPARERDAPPGFTSG